MRTSDDPELPKIDAPRTAGKPWLPALLTLLGSSGLISVFGPIIGELYWEGYLSAYGLTPEEFPALASRVRVYAYTAIVEGVGSVALNLIRYGVPLIVIIALLTTVVVLFQEPRVKEKTQKLQNGFIDVLRGDTSKSVSLRVATATFIALAVTFLGAYVMLSALVLSVSPTQARVLGLKQGRAELESRSHGGTPGANCDHIQSPALTAGCPKVIAYSEKLLAVLQGGRIYRIPRESTLFDSPAATPTGAGAASAADPSSSASSVR